MRIPPRKSSGVVTAAEYNALLDCLQALVVTVGPGLELRQAAGRQMIALSQTVDRNEGDRIALACTHGTQDTDDWEIGDTDDGLPVGVECQEVTDIHWNASTGVLSARLRTKKYNAQGELVAITGEGSLVTILTAASQEVVTDVGFTDPNITEAKRTLKVFSSGEEASNNVLSIDTEIGSEQTQSVVVDVDYNTSTGILKETKKSLTYRGTLGEAADTTIDTAEECP